MNADITGNTTAGIGKISIESHPRIIHLCENDAVLSIEAAGTIIKGDPAALLSLRGSKIIVDGKAEIPIVFTSNKPAGQRAL
ncbi:MAG: hypothetical protein IPN13_07190 [Bacteroidetes bacterium]|nr:hypothetical protein [Bacteroidota bacterium]